MLSAVTVVFSFTLVVCEGDNPPLYGVGVKQSFHAYSAGTE